MLHSVVLGKQVMELNWFDHLIIFVYQQQCFEKESKENAPLAPFNDKAIRNTVSHPV